MTDDTTNPIDLQEHQRRAALRSDHLASIQQWGADVLDAADFESLTPTEARALLGLGIRLVELGMRWERLEMALWETDRTIVLEPPIPLEQMTIAELHAWRDRLLNVM